MLKVGLTGSIGSGKTTVSALFEKFGIPVFNSDLAAREAEGNPEIFSKFIEIVGEEVLVDGVLDRNKMRTIIYNDKEKLAEVSAVVTPYVIKKYNEFLEKHEAAKKDIVMLESAIIFEREFHKNFDVIITVIADKETRIKRVMKRDGLSLELVEAKMANQLSDNYKAAISDYIIINEDMPNCDSMSLLHSQVKGMRELLFYKSLSKNYVL